MTALSLFLMTALLLADNAIHISPKLREALKDPGRWLVRAQTSAIPPSVREEFAKASDGDAFHMAEPGGEWNSTDVVRKRGLPWLRLGRVMSTGEYCIVTYERGGIALNRNVAVFHFRRGGADLVWSAQTASLITAIPELVSAIDSNRLGELGGKL
jgi:hypothetical protein